MHSLHVFQKVIAVRRCFARVNLHPPPGKARRALRAAPMGCAAGKTASDQQATASAAPTDDDDPDWDEFEKDLLNVLAEPSPLMEAANPPYISREINSRTSKSGPSEFEPRQIGTVTKVGTNTDNTKKNQDRGIVCWPFDGDVDKALVGVFDGHGKASEQIAAWAAQQLPVELEARRHELVGKGVSAAIFHTMVSMDRTLLANEDPSMRKVVESAGTTATVAYLHAGKELCVACVGDSRAVLGSDAPAAAGTTADTRTSKRAAGGGLVALDLTTDHKPDAPKERERIQKAGGLVTEASRHQGAARVWAEGCGGMCVSRSIGDRRHKESAGVIPDPEVHSISLHDSDRCLIVASDGLWEFVSSQEAVDVVAKHAKHARQASEALVRLAEKRWNARASEKRSGDTRDDITVTVVLLPLKAASITA